ncbi:MAG: DUF1631 domain-containing protein [gamma proteobacterium endosymbiont of Lamellibrachia anaximandri]|nr:DUF1631 domain-containing protein [gamma proteobacterium endosymbiont of Lamellibrachia anaximandri]MBL3533719.1 DUF1631 domain-containing protein [gamma proteobacterium endosymbiont of Lamellibrachia anaximandri]
MQRQDNIISFGDSATRKRQVSLDAKGRRIVDACRKHVVRTLPQLMSGLFEKLDDAMYELADKSGNDSVQTTYFDAMRELRKERARIDRVFSREVLQKFDRFWETGEAPVTQRTFAELSRDSEMSLLGEDELEDSLAITNMISKSENRYSRELYALGQRFAQLIGDLDELSEQRNPLAPGVVCNAFQEAMRNVGVDLPVKLVIYKLFDKQVMHYIGGLYDELNLVLGKAGVIPKLTPQVRRNPVSPAVSRARREAQTDGTASEAADDRSGLQTEVFETLQQLLNLRRGVAPADGPAVPGRMPVGDGGVPISVPLVETVELLSALSSLQQSNTVMVPLNSGEEGNLRARLASDLRMLEEGRTHRALGEADNDTIDVISMLFEFILDDHSLPDAMKALLSRLQIPMLKVAIIDKTFFSKKVHPARRLLNNLAQAAIGWNDDGDRSPGGLFGTVESFVKRVLTDFDDDPAIFTVLNDEFNEWWEREQRGADVAEQRTNQVTRGKEQLRAAKAAVTDELNKRLQFQKQLPDAVISLLRDGWKDVLLLNYLRQGPESEEWRESLEIVDKLLWSVAPKKEYAERQELLRNIPELLRNLRERLNAISFDQHKMARLFKELQNCHIACLRGKSLSAGVDTVADLHISFPDSQLINQSSLLVDDFESETVVAAVHDKFTEQAESLEIGTWLSLFDGEEKKRIKLSWKSDVTDVFVFVNRKGVKALELTVDGLAMHLRDGSAEVLDVTNAPIMDRALGAMLDALKHTGTAAGPA